MQEQIGSGQQYVLGNEPEELTRLDRQAALIERPTRLLLQAAGLARGMRVLDLGTGLGHVAMLAGELVGPAGAVVGVDRSAGVLAMARERALRAGATHVRFVEGDAAAWVGAESFDAVVGRLLLFHMADPVAVARHYLSRLNAGGLFVAIDFDIGAARSNPPVAVADDALGWVRRGFRAAGAWPEIGARLGPMLEEAGFTRVTTFGIQDYLPAEPGAALLAGVVRSLAPAIIQHGIARAEELDVETLEQRIARAVRRANAVILPPTVVGAWGRKS